MKKKTRFRLKPHDVIIPFICVCVCTLSIRAFWKDLNTSTVRNDVDKIGTITFKHKVAQRKFSDRVVWERLQQDSPLYNMDTIRTADLAQAVITCLDGTVLDIHENTMLQISYSESGVKLSVGGGNIVVDSTSSEKSVEINMDNGAAINLAAGSKLSANTDSSSGEANFQLQSGSGNVKNQEGDFVKVETGESVKISSEGKTKKGGITVTSIASDVKVLNFAEESVPVHLEWKTSEEYENSKVIVETSKTKDFAKIEQTYTTTGASELDLPADNGTLYWRIYVADENQEKVDGKVKVENVSEVSVITPMDGATYRYKNDLPLINFKWNGNNYVEYYSLQISENSDFKQLIFDQQINVQQINVSQLAEGEYFWRVIPYYSLNGIGNGEPSEVRFFTIEKKLQANPPKLTVPAQNSKIVYQNQNDFESVFRWKSEVAQADYQILVASDPDFENVVYSEKSDKTRIAHKFNSKILPDGNYYWKVIRNSLEDLEEVASDVWEFSVEKYIPQKSHLVYPPQNFSVESQKLPKISFTWKEGDADRKSNVEKVFQISKNQNFTSDVTEIKTEIAEIKNLKLESGIYYWRTGYYDEVISAYSYTDSRLINVLQELEIPEIILPVANSKLVNDGKKPVSFAWKKVAGADYYKISVLDESGKIINEVNNLRETSVKIPIYSDLQSVQIKNEAQSYRFMVQPFAEETEFSSMRIGKTAVENFTVRMPAKVMLGTPENNQHFEGLSALKNPIQLTWVCGEDLPDNVQLILKKVLPTGNTKIVETVENPARTVSFERLTPGNYEWTVQAATKEGYNLSAENSKTFVVGEVPELNKPILTVPSKNFVIGPEYLRKNRNIVFQWDAVKNSTDYVFVLYQKTDNGLKKIYSEETGKNTSVKFSELKLLDVGDFEWQVTAYSYAKDGFEEQHSQTAKGQFSISFAKPKKVKTKAPGRLYAN